jgi:hypothetical protein
MHLPRELIFSRPPTVYAPGAHELPSAEVGAGYQSLAMKATKVNWPEPMVDLFIGHLDLSDDAGRAWRRAATWWHDGQDFCDPVTGLIFEYTSLQLFFSARPDKPVYTHENTWVRGAFECKKPLITAITIEGN